MNSYKREYIIVQKGSIWSLNKTIFPLNEENTTVRKIVWLK